MDGTLYSHVSSNENSSHSSNTSKKLKVLSCLHIQLAIFIILVISIGISAFFYTRTDNNFKGDINNELSDERYEKYILLPRSPHPANDTLVKEDPGSWKSYERVPVFEAITLFLLMLSVSSTSLSLHTNRAENSNLQWAPRTAALKHGKDSKLDEEKRPVSVTTLSRRNRLLNSTNEITIPEDGNYTVYACAQISSPKDNRNLRTSNVTHDVHLISGNSTKTIVQRQIILSNEMATYSTSTIMVPLKLSKNDKITMNLSDNNYAYNSKKGNFLGAFKQ